MDEQVVTTSERLWSEEVGLAEAQDPEAVQLGTRIPDAYQFSNKRKFEDGHGPYAIVS